MKVRKYEIYLKEGLNYTFVTVSKRSNLKGVEKFAKYLSSRHNSEVRVNEVGSDDYHYYNFEK